MTMPSTDIAFSPAVKSVQERRGSRGAYARLEQNGGVHLDYVPQAKSYWFPYQNRREELPR
jgi:uncharacterized protein